MKLREPVKQKEREFPKTVDVAASSPQAEEWFFDPHERVTDEMWGELMSRLDSDRRSNKWEDFLVLAKNLVIMFPERRHELQLTDSDFNNVMERLSTQEGFVYDGAVQRSRLALIFPERREDLRMNQAYYDCLIGQMEEKRGSDRLQFAGLASMAVILFPERRADLPISEEDFDFFKKDIEAARQQKIWWRVSTIAQDMAILFPERRDELGLEDQDFFGIENDPPDFILTKIERMMTLTLLSADEVRVTNQGIEVINHAKLGQASTLPDRRLT